MSNPSDRSSDSVQDTDNVAKRVHCVLVVDVSGSMSKAIDEVNRGIARLKADIEADDRAKDAVEILLVTFGGAADVAHGFKHISEFDPPSLRANGGTPMGQALQLAYDRLKDRKQDAWDQDIKYSRSWVFLITDGEPDSDSPWQTAVEKFHEYQARGGCWFYAFGVGNINRSIMEKLTPPKEPVYTLSDNPGTFTKLLQFASTASRNPTATEQKPILSN
ncbi:MAG: VWA domain-containing protein [Phycisphaerales bacterium]|nr:VWA domain-containing protein [Phycisphaerales bacterium]